MLGRWQLHLEAYVPCVRSSHWRCLGGWHRTKSRAVCLLYQQGLLVNGRLLQRWYLSPLVI